MVLFINHVFTRLNLAIRMRMSVVGRADGRPAVKLEFPLINQYQTLQMDRLYQDASGDCFGG